MAITSIIASEDVSVDPFHTPTISNSLSPQSGADRLGLTATTTQRRDGEGQSISGHLMSYGHISPPLKSHTRPISAISAPSNNLDPPPPPSHTTSSSRKCYRPSNPSPRTHRYAKSTGARNTTFNEPVIVRTYSARGHSSSSSSYTPNQEKTTVQASSKNDRQRQQNEKVELPPVSAFTFAGIMSHIQSNVAEDLERIAEICARSRYSLSNQYEVHMPPHGAGEAYVVHVAKRETRNRGLTGQGGPTLQAVDSDDEGVRTVQRRRRTRRHRSMAQGTLETIYSSSRSSEEEKSKKESAAVLAEGVRGSVERMKAAAGEPAGEPAGVDRSTVLVDRRADESVVSKHTRSRSAVFASVMIDNSHASKPARLVSQPAAPQTSLPLDTPSTTLPITTRPSEDSSMLSKPTIIRNESTASTLFSDTIGTPSPFGLASLKSWLPWTRGSSSNDGIGNRSRRITSNAEGALKELLKAKAVETDRKGKGIDRGG